MNASRSRLRGGTSAPALPRRTAPTLRSKPGQVVGGAGAGPLHLAGVEAPQMAFQRLRPNAEGRGGTERVGPGGQCHDLSAVGGGHLPGQAGLADAGVTDQQHAAELPVRRGGELPLQHGQLAVRGPRGEGRAFPASGPVWSPPLLSARSCVCRSCAARWRACRRPWDLSPVDGHRRHRLGQAFEGEPAGVPEAEPAPSAHESCHELAGEDLGTMGFVAQPAGGDHRLAVKVAAVPERLAGVNADPHRQLRPGPGGVMPLDRPLNRHRAAQGVNGAAKDDHEPVPQALDLLASRLGDRLAQQSEVGPADLLGGVVPQPGKQVGRGHEIGEQQRHHHRPPVAHGNSLLRRQPSGRGRRDEGTGGKRRPRAGSSWQRGGSGPSPDVPRQTVAAGLAPRS